MTPQIGGGNNACFGSSPSQVDRSLMVAKEYL